MKVSPYHTALVIKDVKFKNDISAITRRRVALTALMLQFEGCLTFAFLRLLTGMEL
jgi:hypothetical protein